MSSFLVELVPVVEDDLVDTESASIEFEFSWQSLMAKLGTFLSKSNEIFIVDDKFWFAFLLFCAYVKDINKNKKMTFESLIYCIICNQEL